ncbi:MAG: c-type cytochrome [Candidatus Acidiferrales bacterium]
MNSGSNFDSPNTRNRLSQAIAFAAILLAGIFLIHSQLNLHAVNAAPTATAPKTTADGVYSAAQAAHGKDLYSQNCAACHLDDMSGSGEAPPLAGEGFTDSWDGHTVNELDQTVLNTMPLDNPGSLDPGDALAIVTYIFQKNNMPVGKDALKNDAATLKGITISSKK